MPCGQGHAAEFVAYRGKVTDTVLGAVTLTRAWYHCAPCGHGKWFRSRGLFVGSGAVEAGCKSVIGQRLKLSGMRWTVADASAITTLRCQQASRPEDQIWHAPRNQTPAA